ncbi:YMGG-like glycine zipper-containing protein [Elioraea tepidiphila]|jgi:uncharacterized membrane protein|uniref:YMGG-like glycine zipper-containing protein n=1 Tax=Elioraea tepidiphila TaxID=457934 RepID=UPI002FDAB71D
MSTLARFAAAGALLLLVGACAETDPTLRRAGLGAAGGAAAGGLIGSMSGNFGWGALIGAGAGAAGGLLYDYHRRSVDDAYQRGRTGAPAPN